MAWALEERTWAYFSKKVEKEYLAGKKEYDVGYKKPPENGKFKKGESGNPKGRPKKDDSTISLFEEELSSEIVINENGTKKVITKAQAIVKTAINKALKGDNKSILEVLKIKDKIDESKPKPIEEESDEYQDYLDLVKDFHTQGGARREKFRALVLLIIFRRSFEDL